MVIGVAHRVTVVTVVTHVIATVVTCVGHESTQEIAILRTGIDTLNGCGEAVGALENGLLTDLQFRRLLDEVALAAGAYQQGGYRCGCIY